MFGRHCPRVRGPPTHEPPSLLPLLSHMSSYLLSALPSLLSSSSFFPSFSPSFSSSLPSFFLLLSSVSVYSVTFSSLVSITSRLPLSSSLSLLFQSLVLTFEVWSVFEPIFLGPDSGSNQGLGMERGSGSSTQRVAGGVGLSRSAQAAPRPSWGPVRAGVPSRRVMALATASSLRTVQKIQISAGGTTCLLGTVTGQASQGRSKGPTKGCTTAGELISTR
jgi:hypothetical protein